MSNLTDLEICKRIAKIEGVEHASDGIGVRYWYEEGAPVKNYNPLTDDAMCFRLMVKYGIILMTSRPDKGKVVGYNAWYYELIDKVFVAGLNPNKAICLAIIESKEPKT
jgi:hypothetical protein